MISLLRPYFGYRNRHGKAR